MVPADSSGIPRVPPYSGVRSNKLTGFRLQGYHLLWPALSMALHLTSEFLTCRAVCEPLRPDPTTPMLQRSQAWHNTGLGCFPFARRYLGNHGCFLFLGLLRCVTSPRCLYPPYVFRRESSDMTRKGLSHSETSGSKAVCASPKLIAAYHVLHRLHMPRHPPHALSSLNKSLS